MFTNMTLQEILELLQLIIIIFLESYSTWALDMAGSKEGGCFSVEPVPLYMDWAVKHNFYYPMMSRAALYNIVAQLVKPIEASKIVEGSVYYDSCIRWQFKSKTSLFVSGYGGANETKYVTTEDLAIQGESFSPAEGSGFSGKWWSTLTDSITYVVIVICSEDGQIMWNLLSTTKTPSKEVIKNVTNHVIGLGFKQAYFTELRYDACKGYKSREPTYVPFLAHKYTDTRKNETYHLAFSA